jgi:hypothetical protein
MALNPAWESLGLHRHPVKDVVHLGWRKPSLRWAWGASLRHIPLAPWTVGVCKVRTWWRSAYKLQPLK